MHLHDSMWAGSSAWHERLTCTQEDAGSNPARSTLGQTRTLSSCQAVFPKKYCFQHIAVIRVQI